MFICRRYIYSQHFGDNFRIFVVPSSPPLFCPPPPSPAPLCCYQYTPCLFNSLTANAVYLRHRPLGHMILWQSTLSGLVRNFLALGMRSMLNACSLILARALGNTRSAECRFCKDSCSRKNKDLTKISSNIIRQ